VQYKPLVFDAVYTPLETRLLREGKAAGCVTVDGLEMFVGQAAVQFKLFTGLEPPVQLMRETVLAPLTK
jgi:shikimate 5-dehydrogenase